MDFIFVLLLLIFACDLFYIRNYIDRFFIGGER